MKRLEESGMKVSAPAKATGQVDFIILAVPDILINKISTEVIPNLKPDATVILLDPTTAYMNQVCIREDLHYTVVHPCHPAFFKDQPTPEGHNDHFGGISGLQDIVSTHWKGSRDKYKSWCHKRALHEDVFSSVVGQRCMVRRLDITSRSRRATV